MPSNLLLTCLSAFAAVLLLLSLLSLAMWLLTWLFPGREEAAEPGPGVARARGADAAVASAIAMAVAAAAPGARVTRMEEVVE